MRFEFHPQALTEYEAAAGHYAARRAGLEREFIESVEQAIDQIVRSPRTWRIFEDDIRRCLTRVFPYAVLYSIEAEMILIVAVMHSHREPGYWRERVAGRN